jgi:hypothetical protein
MKVVKDFSFHEWLVYKTLNMLKGQHHLTFREIAVGIKLLRSDSKGDVVIQPEFKRDLVRSGTPIE